MPKALGPYEAAWGWIGFVFLEPPDYITFGEARNLKAKLVAAPARGRPVAVVFPPCRMPDLTDPTDLADSQDLTSPSAAQVDFKPLLRELATAVGGYGRGETHWDDVLLLLARIEEALGDQKTIA